MKRKLKFRVWDIQNIKWVNGFGLYSCGEIGDFSECFHNDAGGNGEHYIAQQFTGQKDRNSVDVYEGDIVKYHYEEMLAEPKEQYQVFQVIWCNFYHGWALGDDVGQSLAHTGWRFYELERFGEVIGNIFENHELLKL